MVAKVAGKPVRGIDALLEAEPVKACGPMLGAVPLPVTSPKSFMASAPVSAHPLTWGMRVMVPGSVAIKDWEGLWLPELVVSPEPAIWPRLLTSWIPTCVRRTKRQKQGKAADRMN